jgi:hypothetical protein
MTRARPLSLLFSLALALSAASAAAAPSKTSLDKTGTGASAQSAGDPEQALSACLLASVTPEDKRTLVMWIFAVMAKHPDVRPLTAIDAAAEERIGRDAAGVFQRLMTEQCASQIREVVRRSGTDAIGSSFQKLGEAAMDTLLAHPDVENAVPEMFKYADPAAFERALEQR